MDARDIEVKAFLDRSIASIPARLKAAREKRSLSQRQLAKRAGLDQGPVCAIENGRRPPSLLTVLRLCHAANVSPNELLGWKGRRGL